VRLVLGLGLQPEPSQTCADLVGHLGTQQGTECGHSDRAAHGAQEHHHRAGRAEVGRRDVVLHREHQVLHGGPQSDAQDTHVQADQGEMGGVVDLAQQAQSQHHEDHAAHEVALPQTGLADDATGQHAGHEQPADQSDRHQTGTGRTHRAGELEVLAEVHRRGEHRDADQHRRRGGQTRRTVLEQAQGDDRVSRDPGFDVQRAGQDDHAGEQRLLQQRERGQRERQAHEEAPAPTQGAVDDDATDERATDGRDREDRTDVAGVAPALPRGDHAGDHDLDQGGQSTHPEALDHPGPDQDPHAGCQRSHQRADRVDHQGALDQHLLVVQVGELAPDRRGGGHCEQGGHHHPGVAGLAATEVGDDAGQRVGHHGARQHRHEHREQQARHRLEDLPVRHRDDRDRRCRGGRGQRGWRLVGEVCHGWHVPVPEPQSRGPSIRLTGSTIWQVVASRNFRTPARK